MKASSRWRARRALAAAAMLAANGAGATASLDFDKVFSDDGAPAQSHYLATYRLGAGEHRVEVWRDRGLRLKRRTDDAIETIVSRPPGQVEWSMSVLDLKRRIRTDIDRTNLYRVGHFTDWFALAHSLARPLGPYSLLAVPRAAAPAVPVIAPCRWFALTQGGRTSKICWSSAQRLALVITDAAGLVQWRVTAMDTRPLPAGTFALDDRGFVRNDANRDIETD